MKLSNSEARSRALNDLSYRLARAMAPGSFDKINTEGGWRMAMEDLLRPLSVTRLEEIATLIDVARVAQDRAAGFSTLAAVLASGRHEDESPAAQQKRLDNLDALVWSRGGGPEEGV